MTEAEKKVEDCLAQIREITVFTPKVALILGSGLGALADEIEQMGVVDYSEISGFPVSTVAGHKGRFVFGYIESTPVVIMQGRVHYYEGYAMSDVVLPTRLMKRMGAEILFLTNAAGGISSKLSPGDFMMITDQISTFVPSPLIGTNVEEWGPRFPSMDTIYDKKLCDCIRETAKKEQIPLKEGIYLQTTGPNYESPAEVRMLSMTGAHAVGMSTAVEAIAARHMGMRVCGISCITNMAGGTSAEPLSHEEVSATADRVAPFFKRLVIKTIGGIV
jgi:purine-nucleoside phosphorylase